MPKLTNLYFDNLCWEESQGPKPEFAFSWLDDKDTFKAGEIAAVKIKVLSNTDKLDNKTFKPSLSVNGKIGNSSYVSGVVSDFRGNSDDWKILFTTITSGLFNVMISEDNYQVFDSSLHFQVDPGLNSENTFLLVFFLPLTQFCDMQ